MDKPFNNPYPLQQPQETSYNGNPHDTRRVYTKNEYESFFKIRNLFELDMFLDIL